MNEEQHQRTLEASLPPELLLLLEAFRAEFDSKLKSATSNLKLWGTIGLFGGGTLGGIISRVAAPQATAAAFHHVLTIFS